MHYVYLLKLANGKIYTGSTSDLSRRIKEHRNGKAKSTANFLPIRLVWYCIFYSRVEAIRFERYLKTGSGQAFRNRHLIKTLFI